MIPYILEIKNFISYGPVVQTIDFADHWLICLSGNNGNGKSALLDAITWSLWGQARKTGGTSKADEGLLHLGQTQMFVVFEFACNQRRYRVRREFAKTYGKPHAALDFAVYDTSRDTFVSLTDKTIRATQYKIETTIGLDYETFINSSFLRQGQSNEFSKKSAKERKQVLANILGLSRFDQLQQAALERAREQEQANKLLLHQKTLIEQELAQQESLVAQNAKVTQELATLQQTTLQMTTEAEELDKNIATLQAEQHKAAAVAQRAQETEKQRVLVTEELLTTRLTWQQTHAQLLTHQHQDAAALYQAVLEREATLLAARAAQETLQEQLLVATQQLQQTKHELVHQYQEEIKRAQQKQSEQRIAFAALQEQLKNSTQRLAELQSQESVIQTQLATLEQEHIKLQTTAKKLDPLRQQFEKRKAFYQQLIHEGNSSKQAQLELEQKQQALCNPTTPSCPLCEQLVTNNRKQYLLSHVEKQQLFLEHRITRIASLLPQLKALLIDQNKEVANAEQAIGRLTQLTEQKATLLQQQTSLRQAIQTLMQEQKKRNSQLQTAHQEVEQSTSLVQSLEQKSANSDQEPKLKELLMLVASLQEKRAATMFDAKVFAALQQEKQLLEQARLIAASITAQRQTQDERRARIELLCANLRAIKATLAELKLQHQAIIEYCSTLPTLQIQRLAVRNRLAHVATQKESLVAQQAQVHHELARLAALAKQLVALQKELVAHGQEIQDYQDLGTMFGKNGIQALLIEEAIPEIEQEANNLLAQLTNNQAYISIESLRDLKSGGTRETLDINIADTAGVRPYELYSGGEAFRIDFSLRIAISKLLARRAGTALQTLIIDEGFGSQDEDGLARIMQAIHAIQHEFARIIIVSHLAEFKEHFPSHFVVHKGPSGSYVSIEQRG